LLAPYCETSTLSMGQKIPLNEETRELSQKLDGNYNEGEKLSAFRAYVRLWTYATPFDTLLRILGCLAALGAGTAYPLTTIVFGNLINDFNNFGLGILTPAKFRSSLSYNTLWFVYLFLGKFGVSTSFLYRIKGFR